jgi:hypothetical protein
MLKKNGNNQFIYQPHDEADDEWVVLFRNIANPPQSQKGRNSNTHAQYY